MSTDLSRAPVSGARGPRMCSAKVLRSVGGIMKYIAELSQNQVSFGHSPVATGWPVPSRR